MLKNWKILCNANDRLITKVFKMCFEKERKCRGCSEAARGKSLWIFVPFQRTFIMLSVFIYAACKSCKGWIGNTGKTN